MSDLEARCFVRRGGHLVPADIHADAMMQSIPDGKEILVLVHVPRSAKHHRWFFAMLHKVCQAVDDWHDEEELLDALKHAVGHVEIRRKLTGEFYKRVKSIAFGAMGEDKFRRFVARCMYVLHEHFGIDAQALMEEVNREQGFVVGEKRSKPRRGEERPAA